MFKINYNYLTIFSFISLLILIVITVILGLSIPGQETVKNTIADDIKADFSPQALATPGTNWPLSDVPTLPNIDFNEKIFIDNKSSVFKKINLPTTQSYSLYFEDVGTKSSFIKNINNSIFIFYYALIPGTNDKYYIPKNYIYNESSVNNKPSGIIFEINKAGGSTIEIKAGTPGTDGSNGTPGTNGTPGNSYKNAIINENGILSMDEIEYNLDGTKKTETSKPLGNVKGNKGDPGASITAASINTSGNLIFDKGDSDKITVKNESDQTQDADIRGTRITGQQITADGKLEFKYNDIDSWNEIGNVKGNKGDPGASITAASINTSGNLIFDKGDSDKITVKNESDQTQDADIRGTRITGQQITADGKLEFKYNDIDSWNEIGNVKGNPGQIGDSYKDPVYNSNDGSLKFTKTDYSTGTANPQDVYVMDSSNINNKANIKGEAGSSFKSARIINDKLWLSEQYDVDGSSDNYYINNSILVTKGDNSDYSLQGETGTSFTNPVYNSNDGSLKFTKTDYSTGTGNPQDVYVMDSSNIDNKANVKGATGNDGTSITNAQINSEGELQLQFSPRPDFTTILKQDNGTAKAFNLKGNTGISFTSPHYEPDYSDPNTGYLKFTKTDYSTGTADTEQVFVMDSRNTTNKANVKGVQGQNGKDGSGYTNAHIDLQNQLHLVSDSGDITVPFKDSAGTVISGRNLKGDNGYTGISYDNPSSIQAANGDINLKFEKTDYSTGSAVTEDVIINDDSGLALNIKGSDSPVYNYVPQYDTDTGILSINAKNKDGNTLNPHSGIVTLPISGYQKYLNSNSLSPSDDTLESYYSQFTGIPVP